MGRTPRTRTRPTLASPVHEKGRSTLLLSKRQLEINLARTLILDNPNITLEQYPVSPETGAELLYIAGFEHDDIHERDVVDLGTGTGRLAIGAALLGAGKVVGADVDSSSIDLAKKNAEIAEVEVEWVVSNVNDLKRTYDTVIMNPPYGTRQEHADTGFLDAAFRLAPTVYSIHKSSTRSHLVRFVTSRGRNVDVVRSMQMQLPHIYGFHRKKWKNIDVDLYRVTSNKQ